MWLDRLDQIGQGERIEMSASRALDIAESTQPLPGTGIETFDPIDICLGARVSVSPSDYAEAQIYGELIGTTVNSLTIRREDSRVGEVAVHFPKIGYGVEVQ